MTKRKTTIDQEPVDGFLLDPDFDTLGSHIYARRPSKPLECERDLIEERWTRGRYGRE